MVVKMQDTLSSIGVKKALPVKKFLNYQLNKLRGSGVLQNVLARPRLTCPLDENLTPITFSKVVFLFTVFILGGILSIIIFIFERAISNKRNGALEKDKQCNINNGRSIEDIEIEGRCNINGIVNIFEELSGNIIFF